MAIPITVERLGAAELAALSAHDLLLALNEVLEATSQCAALSARTRDVVSQAKIAVLQSAPQDRDAAKAQKIKAETMLAQVRDRASVLRQYASILQSLLRAANIV